MMTSRQRMLAAFAYDSPDRIPVVYHPSPAGLFVHGKKLLDLFNRYPPDNPIRFDSIPIPPPGTINKNGEYHEFRLDEWGTEWEHRIFGVHGHPRSYPFSSWRAAREYAFPPLASIDETEVKRQGEQFLVFSGWISIFEKLHALRPMDEVLMDLQARDDDLMVFLDRLVEYWMGAIEIMLSAGVDTIVFGDDWGTQTAPLLSPSLFREVFKPRYHKLMELIRRANRMVFFHCCGYMGEIFDELLDLGINGLWPQLGLFEADSTHTQKCRENRVAIYIHADRQQLVPRGTPHEIEANIRCYANRYHQFQGGGIFYVEIENDAPFENVEALIEAIHRYR
jgi:uroporphyrinogen decarboxylase